MAAESHRPPLCCTQELYEGLPFPGLPSQDGLGCPVCLTTYLAKGNDSFKHKSGLAKAVLDTVLHNERAGPGLCPVGLRQQVPSIPLSSIPLLRGGYCLSNGAFSHVKPHRKVSIK